MRFPVLVIITLCLLLHIVQTKKNKPENDSKNDEETIKPTNKVQNKKSAKPQVTESSEETDISKEEVNDAKKPLKHKRRENIYSPEKNGYPSNSKKKQHNRADDDDVTGDSEESDEIAAVEIKRSKYKPPSKLSLKLQNRSSSNKKGSRVNDKSESVEDENKAYQKLSAYEKWSLKNRKKFERLERANEDDDSSEESTEIHVHESEEED